ncbi:hypothetical protein FACS18949_14740 [Clostridia bacterium]|nr:hypothetical protein FACS18949_14740 [Clostridia bacterium]
MVDIPGANITKTGGYFIVYTQMMAGIIILNSFTTSVGLFTIMAKDFENRRNDSFSLTAAKPSQLIGAYFLSALSVSAATA